MTSLPQTATTLLAPAKLNLSLEIFGARPDGLHELRSLLADLALADELAVEPSAGPFRLDCEGLHIPERKNLAWRAAQLLGVELSGVHVRLSKRIPTQAGLGGGSADAAAMLHFVADVARAQGHTVTDDMLVRFAATLGSDVAACLYRGFKAVEGAGERVRSLAIEPPSWGIVLLQPNIRVSTSHAYRLLDGERGVAGARRSGDALEWLTDSLTAHDFARTCAGLHNDFAAVIFRSFPVVRSARDRLLAVGAAGTLLCGSGSCVAGFFESAEAARKAHARLNVSADEWSCATTFAGAM